MCALSKEKKYGPHWNTFVLSYIGAELKKCKTGRVLNSVSLKEKDMKTWFKAEHTDNKNQANGRTTKCFSPRLYGLIFKKFYDVKETQMIQISEAKMLTGKFSTSCGKLQQSKAGKSTHKQLSFFFCLSKWRKRELWGFWCRSILSCFKGRESDLKLKSKILLLVIKEHCACHFDFLPIWA